MYQRPGITITAVTRKRMFDYLTIGPGWSGGLAEDTFLARLYDLNGMPSTDHRTEFNTAAKDIWKHRVVNFDWPNEWVFTDSRFDLMYGPDEAFLKFLVETIHPLVRSDAAECETMVREYNTALSVDGWEVYPATNISGRSIFGFRRLTDSAGAHLAAASQVAEKVTGIHIAQQIQRLRDGVDKDPDLAIGTAKEFLETLCKSILDERGISYSRTIDFPALVRLTIRNLVVAPEGLPDPQQAERPLSALLGNLSAIPQQLAELRNQFGTGHGRTATHVGLHRRHAKLAVSAAATLAVFLYDCHEADGGRPAGAGAG
jgi:hypothetical protein